MQHSFLKVAIPAYFGERLIPMSNVADFVLTLFRRAGDPGSRIPLMFKLMQNDPTIMTAVVNAVVSARRTEISKMAMEVVDITVAVHSLFVDQPSVGQRPASVALFGPSNPAMNMTGTGSNIGDAEACLAGVFTIMAAASELLADTNYRVSQVATPELNREFFRTEDLVSALSLSAFADIDIPTIAWGGAPKLSAEQARNAFRQGLKAVTARISKMGDYVDSIMWIHQRAHSGLRYGPSTQVGFNVGSQADAEAVVTTYAIANMVLPPVSPLQRLYVTSSTDYKIHSERYSEAVKKSVIVLMVSAADCAGAYARFTVSKHGEPYNRILTTLRRHYTAEITKASLVEISSPIGVTIFQKRELDVSSSVYVDEILALVDETTRESFLSSFQDLAPSTRLIATLPEAELSILAACAATSVDILEMSGTPVFKIVAPHSIAEWMRNAPGAPAVQGGSEIDWVTRYPSIVVSYSAAMTNNNSFRLSDDLSGLPKGESRVHGIAAMPASFELVTNGLVPVVSNINIRSTFAPNAVATPIPVRELFNVNSMGSYRITYSELVRRQFRDICDVLNTARRFLVDVGNDNNYYIVTNGGLSHALTAQRGPAPLTLSFSLESAMINMISKFHKTGAVASVINYVLNYQVDRQPAGAPPFTYYMNDTAHAAIMIDNYNSGLRYLVTLFNLDQSFIQFVDGVSAVVSVNRALAERMSHKPGIGGRS